MQKTASFNLEPAASRHPSVTQIPTLFWFYNLEEVFGAEMCTTLATDPKLAAGWLGWGLKLVKQSSSNPSNTPLMMSCWAKVSIKQINHRC